MKKTALLLAILIFIVPFADAASMKKSVDVVLYPITFFFDGEEANTQKQGEFFNGKEYVPLAMIHKGTTYVPLRFVGEKLGKEVGWDPDTYSIWVGQKPEALGTAQTTEPKTELSGLYGLYIGQSAADVKQQRGEPDRVDLSPLGYEWWIYNGRSCPLRAGRRPKRGCGGSVLQCGYVDAQGRSCGFDAFPCKRGVFAAGYRVFFVSECRVYSGK